MSATDNKPIKSLRYCSPAIDTASTVAANHQPSRVRKQSRKHEAVGTDSAANGEAKAQSPRKRAISQTMKHINSLRIFTHPFLTGKKRLLVSVIPDGSARTKVRIAGYASFTRSLLTARHSLAMAGCGSSSASTAASYALDTAVFDKVLPLIAIRVPARASEMGIKQLRGVLVDLAKTKYAVKPDDPKDSTRLLILHQSISKIDLSDATPEQRARIQTFMNEVDALYAHSSTESSFAAAGSAPASGSGPGRSAPAPAQPCKLEPYPLAIGYSHLTMEEILRHILPPSVIEANNGQVPSSFEIVGHLAHMNLKEDLLPYRFAIGRVVLDKNPVLRTVVNKTGNIETVFRTFPMEVIAGDDDTMVEMRHSGATFNFDFRHVYWNSRLQHEHETLVSKHIKPNSIVADMFCGVGPFAIPLAMAPRNCTVYANDLNPSSISALVSNLHRNRRLVGGGGAGTGAATTSNASKSTKGSSSRSSGSGSSSAAAGGEACRVIPYNMDARDFLRGMCASRIPFTSAIMNLPADGIAFCDVFVGLFRHGEAASAPETGASSQQQEGVADRPLPRVHCYCFSKAEDEDGAADDVVRRLLAVLRLPPLDASAVAANVITADIIAQTKSNSDKDAICSPYVLAARGSPLAASSSITTGPLPDIMIRSIRNVAPGKLMMCASFTVPMGVAMADPVVIGPIPELKPEQLPQGSSSAAATASASQQPSSQKQTWSKPEPSADASSSPASGQHVSKKMKPDHSA